MCQSGRAGDEAKKRKSPAKSGRVGITGFRSMLSSAFRFSRSNGREGVGPTERENRWTCALELSPLFLVFPPFDFQNGGGPIRI